VARHQRERILGAVAVVIAAQGYPATSVEHIIAQAGVSRRSFYQLYRGKEEAFLAAYGACTRVLLDAVERAIAPVSGFAPRAAEALHAIVDVLCRHPTHADMCIVKVAGAGPVAIERRNAAIRALAALIASGADDDLPEHDRPPELTVQTVIGGVYEVIHTRVVEQRIEELRALAPELLFSILLPYTGYDAAIQALERERRRLDEAA
jgi:AcrR family transcriptional regulator